MSNHSTTVALRYRSFQPFARLSTTADERQTDADYGIVTYDDDGHYQISSLRVGLRCDHVGDILGSQSEMLTTSSPLDEDRELLLASDSKGVILTRRDGDDVRHLDGAARKADKQAHRDEMARLDAENARITAEADADIAAIRAERALEAV